MPRSRPPSARTLMALLFTAQALPAAAQGAATPPAAAASQPAPAAQEPAPQQLVIYGNAVGLRQTRANVKISAADLDFYPPGVSADKVLERISGIQVGSSNAFGGDGFESTINMRGFGKDSIGFSVDGIPNGRTTLGGGSVPTRYFDSANLAVVDVSQSAGVVGSPSRQALVGHVNYVTQDPSRRFGVRAEAAGGSAALGRAYARIDTGEMAAGLTSYLSVSKQQSKISYIDDPAGRNTREHVDLKLLARLGPDATLRFSSGWNNREETSGTNIVTLQRFKTAPGSDGYTDTWTGVPGTDRNYRGFKGNPREDHLSYLEGNFAFAGGLKLSTKGYYHTQDGIGKESSLGTAGFPGLDGKAASLYFRANNYDMKRRGVLAELSARHGDLIDWRAGAWYEHYDRSQIRRWHPVLDEASGPAHSEAFDATSEDKHWRNVVKMVYAANRSAFLGGRLRLDYGISYLDNQVDYHAPIHDSRTARLNFVNEASVNSGVLPKVGALYTLTENTELFAGVAKNAASVTDATLEGGSAATLAAATTVRGMDTAKAFDLGLRHKGANYALGVQVFAIESTETVAADIVGTLQSENVDQGRRIHGLEVTANGRFGDWRLYGAYTLQDHRYKLSGVDAAGYPARGFIRDGAELVGIARQNLFTEVTWRPLDALKLSLNARVVSGRAGYYANPRIANSGSDERMPGYALVGLNASYSLDKVSVGINVENLGDRRYLSGVAPELLTSPAAFGRYFIGAPRTVVGWVKFEL